MKRITTTLLLSASLLVALGLTAVYQEAPPPRGDANAARPATEKATGGAGAVARSMPDSYRVLLNRSIFARDGHAAVRPGGAGPGAAGGPGHGGSPGMWVGPPGTETTLVFRGATFADGRYSAFIEDVTGGGIRRFNRGDAIAAGLLDDITLNGLDYRAGKTLTHVALGQNLAGSDAPPPPPPATAPATAPSPGNGRGPGRMPGGPPGPGGMPPGGMPPGAGAPDPSAMPVPPQ